jgi:hypothetical protein
MHGGKEGGGGKRQCYVLLTAVLEDLGPLLITRAVPRPNPPKKKLLIRFTTEKEYLTNYNPHNLPLSNF